MQIFLVFMALLILGVWIYVAFFTKSNVSVQSKEEKRDEIINSYKRELREAIEPIKDDKEQRMAKKSELLKRFSVELSRNIFFNQDEIRGIIVELSKEG